MDQLGSNWTNFHELWYLSIFRKSVQKIQVLLMPEKVTGTVHEDKYRFLFVSRSFLLRMRNVPDTFSYKIKTHNYHSTTFSRNSYNLWDNVEKYCMLGQLTTRRMGMACWIHKVTNTHSECVLFIVFPQQHLLHEHTWILRYTYIACLVCLSSLEINKYFLY